MQKRNLDQKKKKKAEDLLTFLQGRVHRATDYFEQKEREAPSGTIRDLFPDTTSVSTPRGEVTKRTFTLDVSGNKKSEFTYDLPNPDYIGLIEGNVLKELFRNPEVEDIELSKIAFFDVETTGLAGGTGTFPFLIGLCYIDGSQLIVEQFFMEDYDREAALVLELKERLADFSALATYNGKTFDIPLMRTRFIYNREPPSVWDLPNLDLLHLSRRLWRHVLTDCQLGTIEEQILGIVRESDVDGALVPRIFFDYVRGIHTERMMSVFDHNAQDVVSLVALLGVMAFYYSRPNECDLTEPHSLIGLARMLEQNGRLEEARACMENALFHCKDSHLSHLIMSQTAKMYKRQNRWKEAVELWVSQVQNPKTYHLDAFIELAKYYEHKVKDHRKARDYVLSAMEFLSNRKELAGYLDGETIIDHIETQTDALVYRLARLKGRIQRIDER